VSSFIASVRSRDGARAREDVQNQVQNQGVGPRAVRRWSKYAELQQESY
jgi:hypothetical protein